MKPILFVLSVLFVSLSFAKPQIYFNYRVFHTADQQSYLTTSLQLVGGSFKYKANEIGGLYAQVEITQIFSWNDSIIVADKYILDSPTMKDSTVEDFYDVQRYQLDPGIYKYELIIKDLISGEVVEGEQSILISELTPNKISISDPLFIQDAYKSDEQNNFVKNGYFILPHLTNYFPPEFDKIALYTEIYNSDKVLGEGEQFLMTCSIENYRTGNTIEGFFKFQRINTNTISPTITLIPIEKLRSGDYNLIINLIDKSNDTIYTKVVYIQRRNDLIEEDITFVEDVVIDPYFKNDISRDSIPYFLGSLMPISERYENGAIRKLLRGTDTTFMEKYFFAFWKETDATDPYRAWLSYKQQVYYAEKLFGTHIKNGWESDRGRIHLKYGAPNSVVDRPREPSVYPYQIWHYYRIGKRSNIRFVFYNPDLVTNDYPLLHSDLQGEKQNLRWRAVLEERGTPNTNQNDPGGSGSYGSNSNSLFEGGM